MFTYIGFARNATRSIAKEREKITRLLIYHGNTKDQDSKYACE